jgi:hypothetical protein
LPGHHQWRDDSPSPYGLCDDEAKLPPRLVQDALPRKPGTYCPRELFSSEILAAEDCLDILRRLQKARYERGLKEP